ncbi:MAG: hypothetical protein WKF95_14690 [Rubrobacter sp.]
MITGIVVGAVVAIVGTIGNYFAGLKRDRQRYEQERLMERERWRREDQLASRNNAHEVKRAARLIDAELLRFQVAADNFVERKDWYSVAELTTQAWENHRGIIAPGLSGSDWNAVLIAAQAAENLLTIKGMQGDQPDDMNEATVEGLLRIHRDIEAGRRSLAPHVHDTLPTSGNVANP